LKAFFFTQGYYRNNRENNALPLIQRLTNAFLIFVGEEERFNESTCSFSPWITEGGAARCSYGCSGCGEEIQGEPDIPAEEIDGSRPDHFSEGQLMALLGIPGVAVGTTKK
jgi:hypothetical protein